MAASFDKRINPLKIILGRPKFEGLGSVFVFNSSRPGLRRQMLDEAQLLNVNSHFPLPCAAGINPINDLALQWGLCIHRFQICGFNHPQIDSTWFCLMDLCICRAWYPCGVLEPLPRRYWGMTYWRRVGKKKDRAKCCFMRHSNVICGFCRWSCILKHTDTQ